MAKLIALWALLFFPALTFAEVLKLLELPLYGGTTYTYSVNAAKKCSFEGVDKIFTPDLKVSDGKTIGDKIIILQRELNLGIYQSEIQPNFISFSLVNSKNIKFQFFLDKPECILRKRIVINKKEYVLDEINIEYSSALRTPVLKRVEIKDKTHNEDLFLYPWALRGQLSAYELNVGPAMNLHSNIRWNNTDTFQRGDPVVEPVPAFFFRYGPVFLNKNGLGSLLYSSGELSLLGMGILEGEPYTSPGLNDRPKGIFLGGILKYNFLELTYYRDFFHNKGLNFKVNLAPEYYVNLDWKLSPQVFVQYWNHDYVDYYFGVHRDEVVTGGLRFYEGNSTMNYGTMFEVLHFIGKWTFVVDVGLKMYGKEVYASPTVVKQNEVRFITSILYKFF